MHDIEEKYLSKATIVLQKHLSSLCWNSMIMNITEDFWDTCWAAPDVTSTESHVVDGD